MPKRYEEEINEILNKFDGDWPPPNGKRRARPPEPPHTGPSFFEYIGPEQLMAFGLLLILAGVVLHFSSRLGVAAPFGIGTYTTAIGVLVLVAGYVLAIIRGGGGVGLGKGQHFWRGQVVDLHPSNRGLGYWWWRFRTNLRRH
ncbi:MAG: hypothetical protein ACHQ7M_13625 [Chloroflexota bacterium]